MDGVPNKERKMNEKELASQANDEVVLDDAYFKNYAKGIKEEAERKGKGNFAPPDYEDVEWVGTPQGENLIVRLIGLPPGAKGVTRKPTDPVIIGVCDVKDEKGDRMQIRLPPRKEKEDAGEDHIIYRLYDKVNEVTWIKAGGKSEKVFKNKDKHPELFELVNKTGYKADKDGKGYTYAAGLKAQQVVVFNCIDRMDDWCDTNKHTKVLSKQLDIVPQEDGSVKKYAKTGIPSYGFINKLADLIGKYSFYENYDVAIKRTGEKTSPYEIRNASKIKQVDNLEELLNDDGNQVNADLIVVGGLTDAEKAYEKYDLNKLFQPTSYRKIEKRLLHVFKLCDACLGTFFEKELVEKAKKEQEHWDAIRAEEAANQESAENAEIRKEMKKSEERAEEPAEEVKPRRRIGPAISFPTKKIPYLKGWAKLAEWEKAGIKDAEIDGGKVVKLIFNDDVDQKSMLECMDCGVPCPEHYNTVCPACGAKFD